MLLGSLNNRELKNHFFKKFQAYETRNLLLNSRFLCRGIEILSCLGIFLQKFFKVIRILVCIKLVAACM